MFSTYYIIIKPDISSMSVQLQIQELYGFLGKALPEVFVQLFLSAYPFRIHSVCFSHILLTGLAKYPYIVFLVLELSPIWHGVKDYDLWIFNRWGEQLFHSTDVNVGWNGKYGNDGKDLGQDVYFWKSKGTFQNGTPFKIAGDVTLIRK